MGHPQFIWLRIITINFSVLLVSAIISIYELVLKKLSEQEKSKTKKIELSQPPSLSTTESLGGYICHIFLPFTPFVFIQIQSGLKTYTPYSDNSLLFKSVYWWWRLFSTFCTPTRTFTAAALLYPFFIY